MNYFRSKNFVIFFSNSLFCLRCELKEMLKVCEKSRCKNNGTEVNMGKYCECACVSYFKNSLLQLDSLFSIEI